MQPSSMEPVHHPVARETTIPRQYIRGLVEDVLAGRINPGRVFDVETNLECVVDAYDAMDQRRAIKSLVRVGVA